MEIQCPNCQRPLAIADEYAGQLMQCPMCNSQFEAPKIAPTPAAAQAPTAPAAPSFEPPPDYGVDSGAEPPSEPTMHEQGLPQTAPSAPPSAPMPPGDYTQKRIVFISPNVVPWVPPICLSVLFLMSFFPWMSVSMFDQSRSAHLWGFSFAADTKEIPMLMFTVFGVILAWPLSIVSFLVCLNVIPLSGPMSAFRMWRCAVVGGVLLLGTIFFSITYAKVVFDPIYRLSATLFLKLAFRLCWIALIFLLLEFWLELRRTKNKPMPRIELHT